MIGPLGPILEKNRFDLSRHENCLKQLKHAWGTKMVNWGTILGSNTMFIEDTLNMAKQFGGDVASKLIQPHRAVEDIWVEEASMVSKPQYGEAIVGFEIR